MVKVGLGSAVLVVVIAVALYAASGRGSCPEVPVVQNFSLNKYLGKWYEVARSADVPFEFGTCGQDTYSPQPSGLFNVSFTEVVDGALKAADGEGYCEADGTGNCYVRMSKYLPWAGYKVLETDYKSYSVVLGTFSIGIYCWQWGWIMSRTPTLKSTHTGPLLKVGLKETDLMWPDQTNC
jgi:apolipoprotein D and lipocalin family protein